MSRSQRLGALLLASAWLAGLCGNAIAASKLFKCVEGGRTVYQQQACSPSAQPEVAASAPRVGQPVPQAEAPTEPIFYPRNGQSPEVTESDRRECNRWATTQRGAMDDASIFQRATFACMEGRGYTVR